MKNNPRTALLVIDVQRGFINQFTCAVPLRIRSLLQKKSFEEIIFTRFINPVQSPYRDLLGWQEMSDGEEIEICEELLPFAEEIFNKNIYSSLTQELVDTLRTRNIQTVFLVGIDTDGCVMKTALDLFEKGFRPVVLSYYCASTGGENAHQAGLLCLRRMIGQNQVQDGIINL